MTKDLKERKHKQDVEVSSTPYKTKSLMTKGLKERKHKQGIEETSPVEKLY